jgi:oligosaccharide 4-alpha-D-glucosyltransferase
MKSPVNCIVLTVALFVNLVSTGWALPQQDFTGPDDYISHEMSGNKLFVYTESSTYSFAPYGGEMLRIGFHFGQDTTYPVSHSVVIAPYGNAALEVSGNYLIYDIPGFRVIIQKVPLFYSVIAGADTLLYSGEAFQTVQGSRMQFYAEPYAAWYGGGSRSIPMNRAGMDLEMLNEPFFGYGWGYNRLNISIPMVVSSEGFALYFENPAPGSLSLGSASPGLISYETVNGPLSCFVIRSSDPDSLMKPFTELTGRQPLPPVWALGYIQSRFGYENETQAANVVNQMVAQGFPMDAIVFDLQWQGGVGEMGNLAWDTDWFPDPTAMMQDFLDKGVKSVCIADPYFTQQCQYFYLLSGTGMLAKNQDNATYILDDFWAGPAGLIDMTKPAAADWFWQKCKNLINGGVTGLWTDLGEPEKVPEDMVFETGISEVVRQTYNLRWSGAVYDRFHQDFPDRRLFNLTRSGYAGIQRYSVFPWSGDVQKSFGGMQAQIPIMLGMGLCGVGYMHADIGGFAGDYNPELYTRWQQMGAFFPVMRAHGSGVVPTEPVYYVDPYKSIVKDFIKLRYQLLPYNYTLAYENSTTGMPPARPLFFDDPALTWVDDEYFWGDDFLVAPVLVEGATSRWVQFPRGRWIDFFRMTSYDEGQMAEIETPLENMPVFVRAGALIPMLAGIQHTGEYLSDKYLVRYFPDPDISLGSAKIYIDDGLTQKAVTENKFSIVRLEADYQANHAEITMSRAGTGFDGEPIEKQMVFKIERAAANPTSLTFNSVTVPIAIDQTAYDQLTDAALYLPDQHQLMVKVQWASQLNGILVIDGLEVMTSFSIAEREDLRFCIYPNPVNEESRVMFNAIKGGSYKYELYNNLGQLIGNQIKNTGRPASLTYKWGELFPGDLPGGVYILRILIPGGDSLVRKVVIPG